MDTSSPLDPLDPNVPSRHTQSKSQVSEKPLPPPPKPNASPQVTAATSSEPQPPLRRSSTMGQSSLQRPSKRVACGNKFVKIALPLENEHGRKTNLESYLQPKEVEERLASWQSKGYNITAFVLASPTEPSAQFVAEGQSRPIHPDPSDERLEKSSRDFRVNIPDRREWEAYVNQVKEERLRALGVSVTEDQQANAKSPAPSLMSRGASSQGSPMLVSPPLPPTSAGGIPPHMPFQGLPQANGHTQKPAVSHFPRFSVVSPFGEKGFAPHHQLPQSQSPTHGTWSPQPYISSQPGSRVGSPAVNGITPSFGTSLSPAPSAQQNISLMASQDSPEMLALMRRQQLAIQAQQSHQQQQEIAQQRQQRPHDDPTRPELGRFMENMSQSQILTPVPRGHRQNPSESLQREVEEAEAILEAKASSKEKNLSVHERDSVEARTRPELKDDLGQRIVQDKIASSDTPETTSSNSVEEDQKGPHAEQATVKHVSKPSLSKFNVNAPEFKLEPKANDTEVRFTSSDHPPAFESSGPNVFNNGSLLNHKKRMSVAPPKTSKLNVAAPVFTPQSAPKPLIPSGEFNFSSSGPTFNPDAPSFNPIGAALPQQNTMRTQENPVEAVKKIFGEVKLPDVVKPTKTSQALPIVKPEAPNDEQRKHKEAQEDESGRPVRPEEYSKRARLDRDDGDQVPMFASPNKTPWLDNGLDDRTAYFGDDPPSASENGVPKTSEASTGLFEEVIDDVERPNVLNMTRDEDDTRDPKKVPGSPRSPEENSARIAGIASDHNQVQNRPESGTSTASVTAENPSSLVAKIVANDSAGATASQPSTEQSTPSASTVSEGTDTNLRKRRGQEEVDRIDHAREATPLRQDILDGVRYVDPSYHEIDAVMKHLNEDSDVGIERQPNPWKASNPSRSPLRSPAPNLMDASAKRTFLTHPHLRSGAPSPSPNRINEPFQYLPRSDSESVDTATREMVARNARFSPSYRPSRSDPNVRRLNSPGSTPPSDWNDAISSADEAKFLSRTAFFDHRVDDLVGDSIRRKLGPIESTLLNIQETIAKLSSRSASRRPRSSGTVEVENSDADDEDDEPVSGERAPSRLRSPLRDRKYEQLRSSINDIAAAQQKLVSTSQLETMIDAIKDLKGTSQESSRGVTPSGELKNIVEEAVARQMRGRSAPVTSSSQAAAAEKSALQIAGLESMLKIADARAEEELKARRATEDALADNQRLLRSALQEATEQRESAEATERSLQEYHAEQHQLLKRMATLEGSQDHMEKMASDLTEKNAALEGTLQEYRISSDQWRTDIDDANHENKDLKRNVNSLRAENEDLAREREVLRAKFDRLQDETHAAARELAADQSMWKSIEEGHKNKLDMLSARLEAEARTRERLELEIERLEAQEKESMRARFQVDQASKANAQLDALVGQLKSEAHEYQNKVSRLEHELHTARENSSVDLHHVRSETEIEIENAKSQVNIVRNELQSVISRLEEQLEDGKAQSMKTKARHELALKEVADSHKTAVREAAESREAALQERSRLHERALEDAKLQNQRALDMALEDKQRSETYFGNQLSLADEKVVHYRDQVSHLEERLEIAKQAANAAVQAAQSKKSPTQPTTSASPAHSNVTSTPALPEKISPQALRESILVLQEQLQAREGRIEELESQLSEMDLDAPNKLKDANVEIAWLRELLGVRIDDLEDIIAALSQPNYDVDAVKDATIRLKANLQMEQQEKERAVAGGGQALPSLSTISNLAASPKSLPLAAAAAWGNWRRGRDSGTLGAFGGMSSNALQRTPSKSGTPQSLFAGLMTPPSTDMRTTPQPRTGAPSRSKNSIGKGKSPIAAQSTSPRDRRRSTTHHGRGREHNPGPVTPPMNLLRKSSYDMDAREGPGFNDTDAVDDSRDPEGFDNATYEVGADEAEPFGPKIGTFST